MPWFNLEHGATGHHRGPRPDKNIRLDNVFLVSKRAGATLFSKDSTETTPPTQLALAFIISQVYVLVSFQSMSKRIENNAPGLQ